MATEKVTYEVTLRDLMSKGLTDINAKLGAMENKLADVDKKGTSSAGGLKSAFAGLGTVIAGIGLGAFAKDTLFLAAKFQSLSNTIKFASDSATQGELSMNWISDISKKYWAKEYIAELAAMEVMEGFPDGTFRPNAPITRAELAALLQKTFIKTKVRDAINFRDVSKKYWAYDAIRETYEMGFFTTLGSREFNPTQKLTRLDVLITLAKGLYYKVTGSTEKILSAYKDASSIRNEHRDFIAALTENQVIINYPDKKLLNPKKVATRAEISALLYRAMVSSGEAAELP